MTGTGPSERRIGVFGGSFDPIHHGHLAAAQEVQEQLNLHRVIFVPTLRSPHKEGEELAPAPVRLRMVREATRGHPRFEVRALELRRAGPSYTVDTLRELSPLVGGRLYLLLGADQWAAFGRWREPDHILRLAEVVLMSRAGEHPGQPDPRTGGPPGLAPHRLAVTRIDISSTLVRRRAREGRSIRFLVPEAVRRIIEAEKLYR